jgi:hypothetical protein
VRLPTGSVRHKVAPIVTHEIKANPTARRFVAYWDEAVGAPGQAFGGTRAAARDTLIRLAVRSAGRRHPRIKRAMQEQKAMERWKTSKNA